MDAEVGSLALDALAASGTRSRSVDVTAPAVAGTYYYGACVDDVADESETANNCSEALSVVAVIEGAPDLVVVGISVDESTLEAGESFTLSAVARNQGHGASAATTLRYYRSDDTVVSTADTEVGTDNVGALAAGGDSALSIDLDAPAELGTVYYGACVDAVSGESAEDNNCSVTVAVTVHTYCRVGDVVAPGGSCGIYGTDHTFDVDSDGQGCLRAGFTFCSGGSIRLAIGNADVRRQPTRRHELGDRGDRSCAAGLASPLSFCPIEPDSAPHGGAAHGISQLHTIDQSRKNKKIKLS